MEKNTSIVVYYSYPKNKIIEDMMRIESLLEGGDRIWMEELEMYYLFFYEIRNGRRVLGKDKVKKILDTLL